MDELADRDTSTPDVPFNHSDPGEEEEFEGTVHVFQISKSTYFSLLFVFLAFGLVGNTFLYLIMRHKSFNHLSYSIYLRILAVVDTLILLRFTILDFLDLEFPDLIEEWLDSVVYCVSVHVPNTTRLLSSWFVVALSVDRFVAIVFPLKRQFVCSRKAAIRVSVVLLLVGLSDAIFWGVWIGIAAEESCDIDVESLNVYMVVYEIALIALLPASIIFVLNIRTIVAINRSRNFREQFTSGTGKLEDDDKKEDNKKDKSKVKVDKTTVSLVSVSMICFLTLTPLAIISIIELLWELDYQAVDEFEDKPYELDLVNNIARYMTLYANLNYSMNFYILIATGEKYRQTLLALFTRKE